MFKIKINDKIINVFYLQVNKDIIWERSLSVIRKYSFWRWTLLFMLIMHYMQRSLLRWERISKIIKESTKREKKLTAVNSKLFRKLKRNKINLKKIYKQIYANYNPFSITYLFKCKGWNLNTIFIYCL